MAAGGLNSSVVLSGGILIDGILIGGGVILILCGRKRATI